MANEYRANPLVLNQNFFDKYSIIPSSGLLSCYYIYIISVIFTSLTINLLRYSIAI